ncbi:RES family NAD+ phosphorylase [Tabrizicola sp.]|uniref:RES family NAD+ phosphorylase n=1 Tax=Tabrizicola sp. TaxID=2005166 RepID=UPI002FDC8614
MRIWRLTEERHSPGLDGEGARLWGGRWNSVGQPTVYTSDSLALAALEVLVHLPRNERQKETLPRYLAIGLDVPDELISDPGHPPGISSEESVALGDAWLRSASSLGLLVPSRVIPLERNVMLNPRHPAMVDVQVALTEPFVFDDRLNY